MEFEECMITRVSDPSGMKLEVVPPGKAARSIEAIPEDEEKEWTA